MTDTKKELERLEEVVRSNDTAVSLFPWGGDAHDFDSENCLKFIHKHYIERSEIERQIANIEKREDTLPKSRRGEQLSFAYGYSKTLLKGLLRTPEK